MKNLNILKKLIKEELHRALTENHHGPDNYMFFQNLLTINKATSEMLQMDPRYVDAILSNGHQWAVDHITTSVDDVSEVRDFLMNRQPMMENDDELFKPLDPSQDSNTILSNIIEHSEELLKYNLGLDTAKLNQIESDLRKMVLKMDKGSGESNQAGNDDLYEKRLTKAELEKREEVAKGIEKSNPKMPMGMKMAIATAAAKKGSGKGSASK